MAEQILTRLVDECRTAAAATDPVPGVRAALARAAADPAATLAEIPEFEGEDHPLHTEAGVSVFLVRQTPNTAGPPHDHGMVAVIAMLEGVEIHRHYRRTAEAIALESETTLGPGEVLALGARDVHAIANPEDRPSIGIHVYLGDLVGGARTLWDPNSGTAMAFTTADYDRMVVAHS